MFQTRIKTHHSAMSEGNKHLIGPKKVIESLNTYNTNADGKAVIYIHVPFCSKICSFCNMRRSLQKPIETYADLIVKEIEQYATLPYVKSTVFDAVYFGGGTPTTLPTNDLRKILKALKKHLSFTLDAEFTIETTVTELSEEKMQALIEEGVTRFSVGIQTFNDNGRAQMGRVGNGLTAYEKLKRLKEYENITVSMDLIYNYKDQTLNDLYEDLNRIIDLDLNGFSMYSLINMRETKIDQAQSQENDEKMFHAISEYMEKAGYHFLELTKMVKNDKYKYIMNRHQGADTLPLGAGAGGSMNGLAMMNPINLSEYEESILAFDSKSGMQFKESYKEVVKFKGDIQTIHLPKNETLYKDKDEYQKVLNLLLENEMVVKKDDGYQLTTKGIFWGNSISRELSELI